MCWHRKYELKRGSIEGDSAMEMRIRALDSPDMPDAVPNPNCLRHSVDKYQWRIVGDPMTCY